MIYWLEHKSIGRSTHAEGTASAHVEYITRIKACSHVIAYGMPENRHQARYWMKKQELNSRKNGRVCDKILLALPVETHPFVYRNMVKDFLMELTKGKVPFYAAFHDGGEDRHNPHCHIVIRDNCPITGKKVLKLSMGSSTHKLHALWRKTIERYGLEVVPPQKGKPPINRSKRNHEQRSSPNTPTHEFNSS